MNEGECYAPDVSGIAYQIPPWVQLIIFGGDTITSNLGLQTSYVCLYIKLLKSGRGQSPCTQKI